MRHRRWARDHDVARRGVAGAVRRALPDLGDDTTVWLVTRGAASAAPDRPVAAAQSLVHGLARVAVLEHPDRFGGVCSDLDAGEEPDWDTVVSLVSGAHGEDELSLRDGRVLARRLRPAPHLAAPDTFTTSGTALVTGGQGALGRHLARWLVERGAERVVLASSSRGAHPGGRGPRRVRRRPRRGAVLRRHRPGRRARALSAPSTPRATPSASSPTWPVSRTRPCSPT